jgi:hypothetical protein
MSPATETSTIARKRVRKVKRPRLQLTHLGPIQSADVSFGDLTVIVGPEAAGGPRPHS